MVTEYSAQIYQFQTNTWALLQSVNMERSTSDTTSTEILYSAAQNVLLVSLGVPHQDGWVYQCDLNFVFLEKKIQVGIKPRFARISPVCLQSDV